MKKLRELGLVFKSATKRSIALAVQKSKWNHDEDNKLRALYDEHRLNAAPLKRIMESIGENHTRNAIIKRMIEIGLIADKSEIVPIRGKRSNGKNNENNLGSDDDGDGGSDSDESDDANNESEREVDFEEMRNNFKQNKIQKVGNGIKNKKSGKTIFFLFS